MKLPPASRKALSTWRLSSFDEPQPQSSPNVMVPRHNSETRSPDLPRSRYRILAPFSREMDIIDQKSRPDSLPVDPSINEQITQPYPDAQRLHHGSARRV